MTASKDLIGAVRCGLIEKVTEILDRDVRYKIVLTLIVKPKAILSRDVNSLNASLAHIACENGDLAMLKVLKERYNFDLEA